MEIVYVIVHNFIQLDKKALMTNRWTLNLKFYTKTYPPCVQKKFLYSFLPAVIDPAKRKEQKQLLMFYDNYVLTENLFLFFSFLKSSLIRSIWIMQ